MAAALQPVFARDLGRTRYEDVFVAMQQYNRGRTADSADYIWLTEHEPVFTQGRAGRAEHLLAPGDIPVIQTDRGGQVTYHGPGQLVAYLLLDLKRHGLGPKSLVELIQQSIIAVLADFGVASTSRPDAPGVYVDGAKIASLGLRISRGCSYHGLALNIAMDAEPFSRINPCGLQNLQVVQLSDWQPDVVPGDLQQPLLAALAAGLGRDWRWAEAPVSAAGTGTSG
jgi:lipoyl(octanoyl) transferase